MAPYREDKFLKRFDVNLLSFEPEHLVGRVLPNPSLKFGKNQIVSYIVFYVVL